MNRLDRQLSECALDMRIAARTSVPVLISANPEDAMGVAAAIAGTTDHGHVGAFVVLAAANIDELAGSMTNAEQGRGDHPRTVIVRDIDAIDRQQQDVVMETIRVRCRTAAFPSWRLITTTSVPLYDRVVAGAFDPRLFYCLNAIHIVMKPEADAFAMSEAPPDQVL